MKINNKTSSALALFLAGLFALESGCSPRKFDKPSQETFTYVASENENKDAKEADLIGGAISYHYKAALRGEKPILICPPEYEDFKLCLIDGAYCLAEKKFGFAIENFKQSIEEAKKVGLNVEGILLYYLGFSYESSDSIEEALSCYKRALELNKEIRYQTGCDMAQEAIDRLCK